LKNILSGWRDLVWLALCGDVSLSLSLSPARWYHVSTFFLLLLSHSTRWVGRSRFEPTQLANIMCGRRLSWTTQSSPRTRSPLRLSPADGHIYSLFLCTRLLFLWLRFSLFLFYSYTFSAEGPGSWKFLVNPSACDGHEGGGVLSDSGCVNEPGQSGQEPSRRQRGFQLCRRPSDEGKDV
jgi:hypothetical protein